MPHESGGGVANILPLHSSDVNVIIILACGSLTV